MCSLSGRLEFVQEIKSPGNVFFEILGSKIHKLPKLRPDRIPLVALLAGYWGNVGCILLVHFSIGGKDLTSMQTVEAVDKKNQRITYDLSEENLMKMYITLKITLQVTSNDEKSFLKWTCIYEKRDSDVPAPDALKGFASEITSLIDEHCLELN